MGRARVGDPSLRGPMASLPPRTTRTHVVSAPLTLTGAGDRDLAVYKPSSGIVVLRACARRRIQNEYRSYRSVERAGRALRERREPAGSSPSRRRGSSGHHSSTPRAPGGERDRRGHTGGDRRNPVFSSTSSHAYRYFTRCRLLASRAGPTRPRTYVRPAPSPASRARGARRRRDPPTCTTCIRPVFDAARRPKSCPRTSRDYDLRGAFVHRSCVGA